MRNFLKKRALLLLSGTILSLSLAALGVAAYVFFAQERLLESLLLPYVQDMARTLSSGLAIHDKTHHKNAYAEHHLIALGPSVPGSLVLVLSVDGNLKAASPGAASIAALSLEDLTGNGEGYGRIVYDKKDYIVVRNLLDTQDTVFFLFPRERMLASAADSQKLLMGLLLFLALGLLLLATVLWNYWAVPLGRLAANVHRLRWGQEPFSRVGVPCAWEVRTLENGILKQSENAIESTILKENYVRDIISTQEDERKRFSHELHDGPLQYVTAAIRRIQIVFALLDVARESAPERYHDIAENLREAEKAAQFSADEIRDLCDEMSPSWLALGLLSALNELAERAERHAGVPVVFHLSENLSALALDDEKSLALLRVFQEAYSNAVRHGKATQVDVSLFLDKNGVRLVIRDNGRGFERAALEFKQLKARRCRGIANMSERVSSVKGSFFIESAPDQGCTVSADIPR